MIATPQECLSDQEIVDFAAGRLPGDRFQLLLAHLDDCAQCQQRADQTAGFDDSFAAALAQPISDRLDECEIIAEADCQAAIFHASKSLSSRMDSMVPPIETLGPYRLLRPLGRGGMGAVYLAEHVRLRKKCAVKLLPRERGFDADWLQRFDREMQAVASLEHPNIVTATDAGDADGWHYLVMEYLDGLDLAAVVRRLGPLPVQIATKIAQDVCRALAVIHDAGLVHRDIKPSNVMLTVDGTVKVLDLGLVLDDQQAQPEMRLTTVGHVIGTLAYAAPEQLSSADSVDARADLYGVGALLFQLVAGRPAHEADRGIAPLVIEKTSKPAQTLKSICPEVPDNLNDLIARLLDRNPEHRPATATEVADELARHATSESLQPYATKAMRADDGTDSDTRGFAWTAATDPEQPASVARWSKLLGIFGLPLTAAVLLAGFLFYVQTDRGILVIESDVDDATITIGYEDQSVDTLQISSGENQTVLRSGRYSIRVDAESDNVSVSESQVAIRRGTRTIVRIRRQDSDDSLIARTGDGIDGNAGEKLYKGEPLRHWTQLMEVEHDVNTLADAMNAVASLAGDDDVDAAHRILVSARRLGGWTSSHDDSKPTQRFMDAFNTVFARLMPQPGIAAIVRELDEGNDRSRAACFWSLLNLDSSNLFGATRTSTGIESWAKNPSNRESAIQLHDSLRDLLQRPEVVRHGLSLKTASELSLKLALFTGRSLADEPGLEAFLQQEIAEASNIDPLGIRIERYLAGESTYDRSLNPAQTIAAVKLGMELSPALWVRSILSPAHGFHAERNELYLRRFGEQPQMYADETLLCLATTTSSNAGGGGLGPGGLGRYVAPAFLIHSNESLWKQMLPQIVEHTSLPQIATKLFEEFKPEAGMTASGTYQLSEEMLVTVQEALRMARSRLPSNTSLLPQSTDGEAEE